MEGNSDVGHGWVAYHKGIFVGRVLRNCRTNFRPHHVQIALLFEFPFAGIFLLQLSEEIFRAKMLNFLTVMGNLRNISIVR